MGIGFKIFLVFVTFLALLHQSHGQTCDPGLDYRCVNETAFQYCLDGSLVTDFPAQSCTPLYCYDNCETVCVDLGIDCVPVVTPTTTETSTELTTDDTKTPEATTTLMPSTMPVTETTTELGTTETSTNEVTTTSTPTPNTTTDLSTEETSATELTTTSTTVKQTTGPPTAATTPIATSAPTDAPPTEAPFICESAGEFQDLGNCSNFYLCIPLSSGDFVYIKFSCPDGSQFDSVTKKCSQNATCIHPSCNEFGFYCISTSQVQLCYDSEPPSGDAFTCPANTYCSMDCQYPCWADVPCTVSTESPLTSTTALPTSTVTLPPTTTDYSSTTTTTTVAPSTVTSPPSSSTSTTALPTSTVTVPPTSTAAPFVCSEAGKFPDPTNCSVYHVCSPKSSGGFYTLQFSCPASSLYNPSTKQCSSSFTCPNIGFADTSSSTTSSVVTSTSRPFACEESGRFADPVDCRSYYVCSPKSSGGFYKIHYQCPPTSAYNQNTRQCSKNSSVNCAAA